MRAVCEAFASGARHRPLGLIGLFRRRKFLLTTAAQAWRRAAVWTGQVQAERATALSRLRPTPTTRAMSHDEIRALVDGLGSARAVLMRADPDDKAEVYRQVGLQLTYEPDERTMRANIQIDPQSWGYGVCPRGTPVRSTPASGRGSCGDNGVHGHGKVALAHFA